MLPGLRFLFAASLVCASLLVFGMGAIALMRASHQQFASAPPGPPPEPVFAQAPQTVPSLSMLRVEPRAEGAEDVPKDDERLTPDIAAQDPTSAPGPVAEAPSETVISRSPAEPPKAAESRALDAAPETAQAAEPAKAAAAPQAEPAATGSLAMPEDQPVSEPATTESTTAEPAVTVPPAAEPPLPQARPEIAAVTPKASPKADPEPAKVKAKPVAKRKARRAKRAQPRTEKLPAVSSAPTLGSLFSGK